MDSDFPIVAWKTSDIVVPNPLPKEHVRESLLEFFPKPALFETGSCFEKVDGESTKFMIDSLLEISLINGQWCIDASGQYEKHTVAIRDFIENSTESLIERLKQLRKFLGIPEGFPTAVVLAYSATRFLEHIPNIKIAENEPEIVFRVYRYAITYEANSEEVKIESLNNPYQSAQDGVESIVKILTQEATSNNAVMDFDGNVGNLKDTTCKEMFCDAVDKAKQYIVDGDIYQVQLCRKAISTSELSPRRLYERLCRINPSPYMSYIDLGNVSIISASPELMIRVSGGVCQVRPIAGTIRKQQNSAHQLLSDPKEQSEHIMLVDLARNDLARHAEQGGVSVKSFMEVEDFGHLLHLVSTIETPFKESCNMWDLITSNFPAGTMTGAPKLRAMEIIAELEGDARGLFSGCVGYITGEQSGVLALTIRTIVGAPGRYVLQSAAGIVSDSDALSEWNETGDKIRSFARALDVEYESSTS
ncbi:anthranilate synthase component I family protein [Vibrio mangrovi]|uniref:Aminodeoxychorismate synthase component 1 n=1 Tax=Vibrio mangrovi TaxID=474394 RepID=A0A1Y6ISB5_9VIBR|nr:anthranilate synthase component I family protein [Vibrio mangrovi]MDW6003516.1 anthranilate synthase component I family protein [Vibrio mangrovi]SMR99690.1 Aminodeoxychorismate synthase component 1 [Vibrio mangrovi]